MPTILSASGQLLLYGGGIYCGHFIRDIYTPRVCYRIATGERVNIVIVYFCAVNLVFKMLTHSFVLHVSFDDYLFSDCDYIIEDSLFSDAGYRK